MARSGFFIYLFLEIHTLIVGPNRVLWEDDFCRWVKRLYDITNIRHFYIHILSLDDIYLLPDT